MKTSVRVDGLKDLDRALGDLGTLYRRKKAARDALREGAEIVHVAAEREAPVRSEKKTFGVGGTLVDTGGERRVRVGGEIRERTRSALRSHVRIGTRLNRSQRRQNRNKMPVEIYVGTRDRAGLLSHFGTRNTAADPWLYRAWVATRNRALQVIKVALAKQIERQVQLQARALKKGRK